MRIPINPIEIQNRTTVSPDGCWLWNGSVTTSGYASITWVNYYEKYKTKLGHRLMYFLWVGDIGEGLEIDHTCHIRRCLNPHHLEPVTHEENNRRRNVHQETINPNFPCGHPRDGDIQMKRDGVYPSGKVKMKKVCRPCYVEYTRVHNALRNRRKRATK